MSDAVPLASRSDLEQYKKLARELQEACKTDHVAEWAQRWAERVARLDDAKPHGDNRLAREIERIPQRLKAFRETHAHAECTLSEAQFFMARAHGFASWPLFAKHIEALAQHSSEVSRFENAADAIVAGDANELERLLREDPQLVHARSTREHRSTLLHYVSANGIEDFRQKTPANLVAITKLLLKAGADVNAESEAYGGRSTTLGLTATSIYPEAAGVQIALLELLLENGAAVDISRSGSTVNDCLHNGRSQAAEFLARRGARLDLEGAAGVGRLDIIKSFVSEGGSLKPPATEKQLRAGFAWACEFGHAKVVAYLRTSVKAGEKLTRGETGLHWAAYGAHTGIAHLLLDHGADVNAIDDTYHGTPLGWALHAWSNGKRAASYYETVALLVRAGATVNVEWLDHFRSDPQMQAALKGL